MSAHRLILPDDTVEIPVVTVVPTKVYDQLVEEMGFDPLNPDDPFYDLFKEMNNEER